MAKANARDFAEKDTGNVVGDHLPEQMDQFNLLKQGQKERLPKTLKSQLPKFQQLQAHQKIWKLRLKV